MSGIIDSPAAGAGGKPPPRAGPGRWRPADGLQPARVILQDWPTPGIPWRQSAAFRFRWFGYSSAVVGWVHWQCVLFLVQGVGVTIQAVGGIWCASQRLPVIVSPTAGGFTQSFAPMVRELRFEGAATQRGGSRCWPVRPYSRRYWTRGLHDAGMRFYADWPLTTG